MSHPSIWAFYLEIVFSNGVLILPHMCGINGSILRQFSSCILCGVICHNISFLQGMQHRHSSASEITSALRSETPIKGLSGSWMTAETLQLCPGSAVCIIIKDEEAAIPSSQQSLHKADFSSCCILSVLYLPISSETPMSETTAGSDCGP